MVTLSGTCPVIFSDDDGEPIEIQMDFEYEWDKIEGSQWLNAWPSDKAVKLTEKQRKDAEEAIYNYIDYRS